MTEQRQLEGGRGEEELVIVFMLIVGLAADLSFSAAEVL